MIEIKVVDNERGRGLIDIFAGDMPIASIPKLFYKKYLQLPILVQDLKEARNWFREIEKRRAKNYALYLLSNRNYHSSQLKKEA